MLWLLLDYALPVFQDAHSASVLRGAGEIISPAGFLRQSLKQGTGTESLSRPVQAHLARIALISAISLSTFSSSVAQPVQKRTQLWLSSTRWI